ncbi:MAG: hypothetical protein QOJ65_1227, partial [Fimbriimonadaceae bacterium]|nr:hypothetical protein [Fimbriimonadaceae bacterium]
MRLRLFAALAVISSFVTVSHSQIAWTQASGFRIADPPGSGTIRGPQTIRFGDFNSDNKPD